MKFINILICTLSAVTYVNAIFNGKDAKPHSAPFIVNMRILENSNKIACSGAIITKNVILTSMYCALYSDFITAGEHNVTDAESTVQKRSAIKIVRHPGNELGSPFKPYNIAILFLDKDLIFNSYIQPIELPEIDKCVSGDAVVYGWGRINDFEYADVLKEATLPLISRKICNETAYSEYELNSANICTGSYEERSVDFNDHGGPLVQFDKLGIPQLIGIVSYPGYPPKPIGNTSVFGNVAAIRDFIDKTLHENENI